MKITEKVLVLGIENEITYHKCENCGLKLTNEEILTYEEDLASGYLTSDKELCWSCEFEEEQTVKFGKYKHKVKTITTYTPPDVAHNSSMRERFRDRRNRRQPKIPKGGR